MWLFRLLFGIDALALAVLLFFFVQGSGDGTVGPGNLLLWLALIGGVAGILAGGWWLRRHGRPGLSSLLLLVLALPAGLAGLFVLSLIVFQPNWH